MTSTSTTDSASRSGDIYGAVPKRPRKTVRLREEGWRKATERMGITSDAVLGSVLSYNPSHIYRVKYGQVTPGTKFIATACDRLKVKFDELFEIIDDADEAEVGLKVAEGSEDGYQETA